MLQHSHHAQPRQHSSNSSAVAPTAKHSWQRQRQQQLRRRVLLSSSSSHTAATASNSNVGDLLQQQQEQLARWAEQHGSCHVPRSATDARQLQRWVSSVRRAARAGQLSDEQKQQLDALGFVWKPSTTDAKWHSNYHLLRCWLADGRGNSLEQLLQHAAAEGAAAGRDLDLSWLLEGEETGGVVDQQQQQQPQQPQGQGQGQEQQQQQQQQQQQEPAAADGSTGSQPVDQQQQQQSQPEQQQPLPPDIHAAAVWLQRQVELYGKLKLTPVKVQMLRRLGVRLRRQAGLTKPNLHPLLQGQNPDGFKRRAIVVNPATQKGRRVVAAIIARHTQQLLQQQSTSQAGGASLSSSSSTLAADESADMHFMHMLAALQRWRKKHGSCYVPLGVFDAPDLAQWVAQARQLRGDAGGDVGAADTAADQQPQQQQPTQQSQQQLAAWEVRELDAVGFVWQPTAAVEDWYARYHQLRHFKQLHHHLRVPSEGGGGDGGGDWAGLAQWLSQQEAALTRDGGSGLSATQAKLLGGLGLVGQRS